MNQIDQPNALLDREFLIRGLEAKNVRAYFEYIVDCAVALGANATEAKKELMDVLNFEIALANVNMTLTLFLKISELQEDD